LVRSGLSPGTFATLTQTASAVSSGRSVFGARGVTISSSSRCDLDDSLRRTFKDGNANTGPGEADAGNLGRGTRSSKARSDPRADAECRRTRNSRAERKTKNWCKEARNSSGEPRSGCGGSDVPDVCKSRGRYCPSPRLPLPSEAPPYRRRRGLRYDG